jgi:hypothetical protein
MQISGWGQTQSWRYSQARANATLFSGSELNFSPAFTNIMADAFSTEANLTAQKAASRVQNQLAAQFGYAPPPPGALNTTTNQILHKASASVLSTAGIFDIGGVLSRSPGGVNIFA